MEPLSSSLLDERRRRALFRARRRGVREMDVVMGRFCDACLPSLSQEELADFERLLDVPDAEVFAWLTEAAPTPAEHDTQLFSKLRRLRGVPDGRGS